jgi:hypothetical protein
MVHTANARLHALHEAPMSVFTHSAFPLKSQFSVVNRGIVQQQNQDLAVTYCTHF